MACKRCKREEYIKNGKVLGKQRYKCKGCGYQFTDTPVRGYGEGVKRTAVFLYGVCGLSMLKIGKILGVSDVSVGKWLKEVAADLPEPIERTESKVVMMDEMWHFVNGKKTEYGSGGPYVGYLVDISDGLQVIVRMRR